MNSHAIRHVASRSSRWIFKAGLSALIPGLFLMVIPPCRAALSFSLDPASATVTGGGQFTANVVLSPVTDLTSFQFTLRWDPSVLFWNSAVRPTFDDNYRVSIGTGGTASGNLTVSWFDANGANLAGNTTVLTLVLDAAPTGGQSALAFADVPLLRQVSISASLVDVDTLSWNGATVTVTPVPEPVQSAMAVFGLMLAGAGGTRWLLDRARTRSSRKSAHQDSAHSTRC